MTCDVGEVYTLKSGKRQSLNEEVQHGFLKWSFKVGLAIPQKPDHHVRESCESCDKLTGYIDSDLIVLLAQVTSFGISFQSPRRGSQLLLALSSPNTISPTWPKDGLRNYESRY